jgi:hypothetical protein
MCRAANRTIAEKRGEMHVEFVFVCKDKDTFYLLKTKKKQYWYVKKYNCRIWLLITFA